MIRFLLKLVLTLVLLVGVARTFSFVGRTADDLPQIFSVSPRIVEPEKTVITIKGDNFGDIFYTKTLFVAGLDGDIEIELSNWSNQEIKFVAPAGIAPGPVKVRKVSGGRYSEFVETKALWVRPRIFGLEPEVGRPGDKIVISGSGFRRVFSARGDVASTLRVLFSGKPASIVVWENARLEVKVPQQTQSGSVVLEFSSYSDNEKVIATATPDFIVGWLKTNDPLFKYQTFLSQAEIDRAWQHSTGSPEVVVAVLDDGIFLAHPDLEGNFWVNEDETSGDNQDNDGNGYVDDRFGWNFVDNSADLLPKSWHGTFVAGIIGARTNNQKGVAGINWQVKLMPLIVCDQEGKCDRKFITKAIYYAVDNGADIINISLGTKEKVERDPNLDRAIEYAFSHGTLVIAAAGNSSDKSNPKVQPTNLDITPLAPVCNDVGKNAVLGVGALDKDNQPAFWSNYGKCVDIYAPGEAIISTISPLAKEGEYYGGGKGTSFATAIVSGIAALVKAKHPLLSAEELRDRLLASRQAKNKISAYQAIIGSATSALDWQLAERLAGRILLQVEAHGEAWYISPTDYKRYFLGRPADAFAVMREQGIGISNSNLAKIPLGLTEVNGADSDSDGLADLLEEAIGTNKNKVDSDNDGFNDKEELNGGYNPNGAGKLNWDENFAKKQAGKIFLQVEAHGEAWYISPTDYKRYFLGRPADAFAVMRRLGLGITNRDLGKIPF